MAEKALKILTKEQMHLELALIVNKQLYNDKIIDKTTYETTATILLGKIQKIETA